MVIFVIERARQLNSLEWCKLYKSVDGPLWGSTVELVKLDPAHSFPVGWVSVRVHRWAGKAGSLLSCLSGQACAWGLLNDLGALCLLWLEQARKELETWDAESICDSYPFLITVLKRVYWKQGETEREGAWLKPSGRGAVTRQRKWSESCIMSYSAQWKNVDNSLLGSILWL